MIIIIKLVQCGGGHRLENPKVKMPSRTGCFQEIDTLYCRQWIYPYVYSHHARDQRKRATANM